MSASRFDFHPRALPGANERWRDLDRGVARWVLAHGGAPALAQAAAWASLADGQGDVALMLEPGHAARLGVSDIGHLAGELRALALDAPRWIGTPACMDENTAFVLDDAAFYLRRNFLHERAVAAALRARLEAPRDAVPGADAVLDALFDGAPAQALAQREAVRRARGRRLFVLTGGPGTGKTTTVLRMLLALAHDFRQRHARLPRVCLSAPTGKAAQRLTQSLREGILALSARLPAGWEPELALARAAPGATLHRLLGSRGPQAGFTFDAERRLAADIVVVDEASMVDLALLRALLVALPDSATLVLVGDADQLPAIGTGSALADVVEALGEHAALARLGHSFRADQALGAINAAVRDGDAARFHEVIDAAGERAAFHRVAHGATLGARLVDWASQLQREAREAGALDAIDANDPASQQRALATLGRRQLLCALREGPFGAVESAMRIERGYRERAGLPPETRWYPGRAVVITRNDAAAGLFNGDIGLCLRLRAANGRERLQVLFDPAPDSHDGAPRRFDPDALPAHECAFALTVHKSQGSEYDRVAVLLPPDAAHPLLSRQMLYTALSRARRAIDLWATPPAVATCLGTALQRTGGLARRLREG